MTGDPTKLKAVGATDLERRLLEAAAGEQPSPELTQRMRLGLGLAPIAAAPPAPSPVSAVAAKSGIAGWMAAGVVAAAVAGGVMVTRLQAPSVSPPAVPAATEPVTAAPAAQDSPIVARGGSRAARSDRAHRRVVASGPAVADIQGEIALVDAARTAVKSGEPDRALALLHRYDTTFPGGAFRPEVAALRIEALAADGQTDLARTRARDFIAAHPESPLSARLARIAGTPPG